MEALRARDARAVLRFVAESYDPAPGDGFRLRAIERLRELVPADMAAWVETERGRDDVAALASPADPLADGPRRFARVRDQHPILRRFESSRRGGAVKLSDFLAPAQLESSRLYQDFFRPAGFAHQMAIALPTRGARLIRLTLNRARGDFGERDRLVLDLVRPHLARAYRGHAALARGAGQGGDLEQAADALDVGVLTVGDAGRVGYANRSARRQLAFFFPDEPLRPRRLPRDLDGWLAARLCDTDDVATIERATRPLRVVRDGAQLEVLALRGARGDVLVLREDSGPPAPRSLEALGLTRRQAEVLAWLAQGKTNGEIATILAISPSTVARHVEAIFARLDVQTRTAAAALAFPALAR